jgi:hypothetical protein
MRWRNQSRRKNIFTNGNPLFFFLTKLSSGFNPVTWNLQTIAVGLKAALYFLWFGKVIASLKEIN